MGILDFAAGYALGGKAGHHGLDDVVAAAQEVFRSREFQSLVAAARSHAATTLRQLGDVIDGQAAPPAMDNVLDMVKALVERQRAGLFGTEGDHTGTEASGPGNPEMGTGTGEPPRVYPAGRPFES